MFVREIDADKLIRISGKDLADLTESLSGNDDLSVLIGIAELHIADRDAVSVQGDHSEPVVPDLHELAGHHAAALVAGDREDRPVDQVPECELGDHHFILLLDLGKVCKIGAVLAKDRKLGFLACNCDLLTFGHDNDVVIGKLSYNTGEYLRVDSDDSSREDHSGDDCLYSQFHIIGNEANIVAGSIDQDAFQDRHCSLAGHRLGHDLYSL